MRKLLAGLCAVGALAVTAVAGAEETSSSTESKVHKESTPTKSKTEAHKKSKVKAADGGTTADMGDMKANTHATDGGTVTDIERAHSHDEPGTKNDTKTKSKEHITKDKSGKVTSDKKTNE